ncbi:MAG: TetR/AcrR family transcriptional regulator [Clostridiaceae bacterium]|jgi:AcrR family transcriptional regulator|nr:TetR/AcrR family transcriptional regulator [Clostridiaceae bacterium]
MKDMNTRERILETAIELFAKHGFNDVSVRDITGAVGIKESSLYNHFKSKQQLLDEIFNYLDREFSGMSIPEDEAAKLIEVMDPAQFMDMCIMNFKMYFGKPRLIKIWRIVSIERFRNARANEFFTKNLVDYPLLYQSKVFEAMIKKGIMVNADPKVLARAFYSFILFIYMRYFEVDSSEYSITEADSPEAVNPVDSPEIQEMIKGHMDFLRRAFTV